jgi:2-phospho-L-lactate guanylyltransferase
MRTAAILPVKQFTRAKQRLGRSVEDQLRLQLARAMVTDVLQALADTAEIELTIVVTRERAIEDAARAHGALIVDDEGEDAGQSAAAALGIAVASRDGFERILCVPGDCPALDPAELAVLLAAPAAPAEVVIIPDRHGEGTNGLLLSPPGAISPSFGPGSRERHRQLAEAAGASWRIAQPPSLLLDIDTGADLALLRERLSASAGRAPLTRAVLGDTRNAAAPAGAG